MENMSEEDKEKLAQSTEEIADTDPRYIFMT
jgi:hypothetical protein